MQAGTHNANRRMSKRDGFSRNSYQVKKIGTVQWSSEIKEQKQISLLENVQFATYSD
jgi:hypothetical protein